MKLKRLSEDLDKFQSTDCLTIEDALGILQNVGRDITKETGGSIADCEIRDPDALMNLLIWMGNLYSRIYDKNSSVLSNSIRLGKYKELAEKLQKEVAEQESAGPELRRLQEQVDELRSKKNASAANEKALTAELERLRDDVESTERRSRELEAKKREYQEKSRESDALRSKAEELDRSLRNLKELEIPEQREKCATLELQRHQFLEEKQQIEEEIGRYEEEIQRIRDKTADVELLKKEKRKEQLLLTEQLNTSYGEAEDLDKEVKSLKNQIAELEQQLNGKSAEGLTRTLEARKDELKSRIETCASLETAIQAYKGEIESQEKILSENEETLKSYQNRAKEVEESLKLYESELSRLEQRKNELKDKENRLDKFRQIHQTLTRNASILEVLPGVEPYTAEIQVEKILQTADRILEDLQQAIKVYTRTTNETLEAIK